jgi:hypothetical protein
LHASDIAEEPEEQVDGVYALIDERAAAVERESAAPAGVGVILGRAIPLHASVDEEDFAKEILIEPGFELANVGLGAVLKKNSKADMGGICGGDERVGARGVDFERFFGEDMEAAARGGDALLGVKAGRAAEDDEIYLAMIEEGVEVFIRRAAKFMAEAADFLGVRAMDGGNFHAGDGAGSASVSFGDVASAD